MLKRNNLPSRFQWVITSAGKDLAVDLCDKYPRRTCLFVLDVVAAKDSVANLSDKKAAVLAFLQQFRPAGVIRLVLLRQE